jgi:hypothetical protein
MKRIFFIFIVLFLLIPVSQVSGQNLPDVFDTSDFPQWGKDLRRWDIITFGIFPFCVFFTTVVTDSIRWYNENGLDFSESGRRYAPWPLKSAGAYERTTDEHFQNIFIAACLAASLAIIDLIIVKIRQGNERRRVQNLPSSTFSIERSPVNPPPEINDTEENEAENENSGIGDG